MKRDRVWNGKKLRVAVAATQDSASGRRPASGGDGKA